MAGLTVWGIMMEVDNRETRKFEAVMTVSLVVIGEFCAPSRPRNLSLRHILAIVLLRSHNGLLTF